MKIKTSVLLFILIILALSTQNCSRCRGSKYDQIYIYVKNKVSGHDMLNPYFPEAFTSVYKENYVATRDNQFKELQHTSSEFGFRAHNVSTSGPLSPDAEHPTGVDKTFRYYYTGINLYSLGMSFDQDPTHRHYDKDELKEIIYLHFKKQVGNQEEVDIDTMECIADYSKGDAISITYNTVKLPPFKVREDSQCIGAGERYYYYVVQK